MADTERLRCCVCGRATLPALIQIYHDNKCICHACANTDYSKKNEKPHRKHYEASTLPSTAMVRGTIEGFNILWDREGEAAVLALVPDLKSFDMLDCAEAVAMERESDSVLAAVLARRASLAIKVHPKKKKSTTKHEKKKRVVSTSDRFLDI